MDLTKKLSCLLLKPQLKSGLHDCTISKHQSIHPSIHPFNTVLLPVAVDSLWPNSSLCGGGGVLVAVGSLWRNFDPIILQVQYSFSTNPARDPLYHNKIQSLCVCVCVCVFVCHERSASLVNIRRLLEILLSGRGHSEMTLCPKRHIHAWMGWGV